VSVFSPSERHADQLIVALDAYAHDFDIYRMAHGLRLRKVCGGVARMTNSESKARRTFSLDSENSAPSRVVIFSERKAEFVAFDRFLASPDIRVHLAADELDLVASIRQPQTELSLLSFDVLGAKSLELCRELNRARPFRECPAIVLAGLDCYGIANAMRKLGISWYRRKPVPPQLLIKVVRDILRSIKSFRANGAVLDNLTKRAPGAVPWRAI
jgi:PleD family two-component response regulator